MIAKIKISQEDFTAEMIVKTVYDDNEIRLDDEWYARAKTGEIYVSHIKGHMDFKSTGKPSEYYQRTVMDVVRVFKAIYPNWKEY